VTGMGKELRLARIMDPDTRTTIILPMDHAIEESFDELVRPRELVAELARAGVDAFLMRRGLAAYARDAFAGRAGWIQRITGRSGLSRGRDLEQLVLGSIEEAARNGADAVVPTFFLGPDTEAEQLTALALMSDECNRLGLPLVAEIFPAGDPGAAPYEGPYSVEDMRLAVRIASEEGADLIKTWYTGDPESFREVIDYSLVPVVVAGGARRGGDRGLLEMVAGAMEAGAAGVAVGRRVWQSPAPAATVRALQAIVRERAPVEHALALLEAGVPA
jgi:fructose-bisphosphate aldolase/2-amino-3,7-dideoxy-D-threo-hept-6-ulosonate synthase